ncbi:hypothetical protein EDB85DRAFT_1885149 [Lactarius pseudohatsudake]|nr:hypothetical protein EDB85DRAFT_1885149 [Lactarius pseudohatsudake]
MTARSVEAAPMRAETLATEPHSRRHPRRYLTVPRRHARQQQRENNQEQPHQVASSADATATAPQLRGGSHVAIKFQRTLRIDRSVYRSRGSVRDRTRSGSSKTDSQHSKELKRKTSAATTVALRTRRPTTRDARGDVRDTRESAAAQLSVQVKEYCKSSSSDCAGVARIFVAHARVENSSTSW